MSLKDEIEKLINAERSRLENQDKKNSQFYAREKERFAPLRVILEKISSSIESKYLETEIYDDSATLSLGRKENSDRSIDIHWRIEPNCTFDGGEAILSEAPGFLIEETSYFRYPESDIIEQKKKFKNEHEVAEYLIKKIADQVAYYRHSERNLKSQE